MLKIKPQYDKNTNTYRLIMKGHCGFADFGKDIICAACSSLCLALAQTIKDNESHLQEKPKIKISNGRAYIEWKPQDKYKMPLETSLYTVVEGFRVLENEYPEYIKILR